MSWPGGERSAPSNSRLLERLLAKTAAQLQRATSSWPGLSAAERVSAFVREFATRMAAPIEHLKLPMTRAQLGSYLGLAEETVVRALAGQRYRHRITSARERQRSAEAQCTPVVADSQSELA